MNGDRRGPGRAIAWALVIGAGSAFLLQGSTQGAATSPARAEIPEQAAGKTPARLFLADLDGDGSLDKVRVAGDGALSVALNRGGGAFEPVGQTIPGAAPHAVLADDLDGDGRTDLYLLTARGAMAFLGDGTGLLREATSELGLEDAGLGVRAERVDLDGIPPLELVIHQVDGDVVFWPQGSAFRRDADSPPRLDGGPTSLGRVAGGSATADDAGSPDVALGSEGPAGSASWSSSGPRTSIGPALPRASSEEASGCADSIADQARPTTCIKASTTPTLGSLYPLGQRFFVATSGRVGIGTTNPAYDLDVVSSFHCGSVTADSTIKAGTTITLDALTGRTKTKVLEITGGSDLVEGFETGVSRVEPGTVMCIDASGTGELEPSTAPYDRRVAGIVSGAGGVSPGIRMGQTGVLDGEVPVAMAGRVYARATTEGGAIEPGDPLTTSATPGCAMKAADAARSPGAVLGKALTGLSDGAGLVLVLVDLQ